MHARHTERATKTNVSQLKRKQRLMRKSAKAQEKGTRTTREPMDRKTEVWTSATVRQ